LLFVVLVHLCILVPLDPGGVLNFLQDVNARQEQLMSDGINPVSSRFIFRVNN
jgi:hypothetical protein